MDFVRFEDLPETQKGNKHEWMLLRYLTRKMGWTLGKSGPMPGEERKSPKVFLPDGRQVVAPDLFGCESDGTAVWVDAKGRDGVGWSTNHKLWTVMLDTRLFRDYSSVALGTGHQVFVMFLSHGIQTKSCPFERTPEGLFVGTIGLNLFPHHVWQDKTFFELSRLSRWEETIRAVTALKLEVR